MNCKKSNTFLIPRLSAKKSLCVILDLSLCHRGNRTRTSTNVSDLMICATYRDWWWTKRRPGRLPETPWGTVDFSTGSPWRESTIWANRILVTCVALDMLFPLVCVVGGEQCGEKQKLSKTSRKILLLQHGNNHWSWQRSKRIGFSDSIKFPTQPVDFLGSFRKKGWHLERWEIFFLNMSSEILRITYVTWRKYKGAGWDREKQE